MASSKITSPNQTGNMVYIFKYRFSHGGGFLRKVKGLSQLNSLSPRLGMVLREMYKPEIMDLMQKLSDILPSFSL